MPIAEQDPLSILVQRFGGWLSIQYDCVDYYIPEEHAYIVELCDPLIIRKANLDYIM